MRKKIPSTSDNKVSIRKFTQNFLGRFNKKSRPFLMCHASQESDEVRPDLRERKLFGLGLGNNAVVNNGDFFFSDLIPRNNHLFRPVADSYDMVCLRESHLFDSVDHFVHMIARPVELCRVNMD